MLPASLSIARAAWIAVAAVVWTASPAWSVPPAPHGGVFPGGVPAPTPPAPAGPPSGKFGGPMTPGTGAMPTPAPIPVGPTTGGATGRDLESWRYWWAFNKDPYLQLRERVARPQAPVTPTAPELDGAPGSGASMRPTRETLRNEVYPALKAVLEKESQQDLVMAALIAIAEIGIEPEATQKLLEPHLASSNQRVSETAAFACGVLGDATSLATLRALFEDREEGRKLCGDRKEVPWRTRAMAAYALGIMGGRKATPQYRDLIQGCLLAFLGTEGAKRSPQKDLRVATILALGMIPDPARRALAALERYMADHREKEELVCAHVPSAIARLLKHASGAERERYANEVIAAIAAPHRRSERLLRPSMPIALGLLTRAGDPHARAAVGALRETVDREISTNPETSYMALIALGQIAGSDAPGGEAETRLLAKLDAKGGGRVASRAWTALALGIAGFEQAARGAMPVDDPVGALLLDGIRDLRDPEQVSAFAIALGLRKYPPARKELLRQLGEVKDDRFRGFFATGLGLLDAQEAAGDLREIVGSSTRRPWVLNQAAIALGILGDKSAVPALTAILADVGASSAAVQAAVSDALGFIGDHRAVTPLVKTLSDERAARGTTARIYAAVALGLVGDKDPDTWNYQLTQGFNYFATVETLLDMVWDQ